jgi:Subtilase family
VEYAITVRAALGALRATATSSLLAVIAGAVLLCAPAGAAGAVSPLPASDYGERSACAAPTPGRASCLAIELVPQTAAARAHTHPLGRTRSTPIAAGEAREGAFGLRPQDLQSAYFPGIQPDTPASEPQTIAIVDAYHDLNAETDLKAYDEEFSLPPCTTENKCFQQLNEKGESGSPPFPQNTAALTAKETACKAAVPAKKPGETRAAREAREAQERARAEACTEVAEAEGWTFEISTDIETAHAVCQNCHIMLLETNSPEYSDLGTAENSAARLGATEITNSWGGEEPATDGAAFNHPGIVITASSGDDGYLNWTKAKEAAAKKKTYYSGADYPASSPHVVAVGGTKLTLTPTGSRQSETVWNEDPGPDGLNHGAGGGGCSVLFSAPVWQLAVPDWTAVGCEGRRAVADVSAVADPYTGVAVYDSTPNGSTPQGWAVVGGTSVASPLIASMFALAGGAHGVEYPAGTLYAHLGSASLQDITAGGNGECDANYAAGCTGSISPVSPLDCGAGRLICSAGAGFDGPSGVGAPNGITAFQPGGTAAGGPNGSGGSGGTGSPESPSSGTGRLPPGGEASPGGSASSPSKILTPTAPAFALTLSRLALTRTATAALKRLRPKASAVAFTFTLNAPARVRITLWRHIRVRGHLRWLSLPGALTVSAVKGRNSRRLHGGNGLPAGSYRLTLTPARATSRSLLFRIA